MQGEKLHHIQNLVKKNKMILIAVAEIVLVVIALISYFNKAGNLARYDFSAEQFLIGYIDENFGDGLIPVTDEFLVEKGYYVYSVDYEGTAKETSIYPYSYIDYYDKADLKECYFEEGNSGRETGLWVNMDLMLRFYMWHEGEGAVHINAIHLEETPMQARRDLFGNLLGLMGINVLLAVYYYHKKHQVAASSQYIFAGLLLTVLAASYPVLAGHGTAGHDLEFHLVRIEGIKDGLLAGQFPVRINPDFYCGYGYANPIMYGEVLLYVPALLRLAGISLTGAYCIYIILVNFLTTFGAYWCFGHLLQDKVVGAAVTFLYVMAPYRLTDIYVRAAVGEYSAMIFLPFLAYGLYRIYTDDVKGEHYRFCFVPLALGLSGIIQTHVLTGEMAAVFILLTCLVMAKRTFARKRFWALAKSVITTVLLNAWFLVPFADYYITQNIKAAQMGEDARIRATGIELTQIGALFPHFSLDVSEMPLTLGLSLVLGMFLCGVMLWVARDESRKVKGSACFFLLAGVLAAGMATVYFPWDSVVDRLGKLGGLFLKIQFVWRYLGIAVLFGAAATGFGLVMLKKKEGMRVFVTATEVLCILAAISGGFFLQGCVDKKDIQVDMDGLEKINLQIAAKGEEYALLGMEYDIYTRIQEVRAYGGATIENYEKQGTNVRLYVENDQSDGYVLLPLQAYKGYRVESSDGSIGMKNLAVGPDMVVQINIPGGFSGELEVRFGGFWYWRLAEVVSVGTLVGLLLYGWRIVRNRKKDNLSELL